MNGTHVVVVRVENPRDSLSRLGSLNGSLVISSVEGLKIESRDGFGRLVEKRTNEEMKVELRTFEFLLPSRERERER